MDNTVEREFWVVVKEHERPPYFFDHEGVGNRLNRAARVVLDGRLTPNSDGSYTVEGSEGRTYRVAESCSCPQSQKGRSKHCYHSVAVALYVEWKRRLGALLQQEALPLPPTSAEERLAAAPHHAPQEVPGEEIPPMADHPDIPAPEEAPVAVLKAPTPEPIRVPIPAEYVMQIQGKRHVLYAGLVIGAQRSGLVSLSADWTYNDTDLSLAHAVATFSDGRRYEDSGDASPTNVNKGIAKHFRRVALTRAKARALRDALGIQECSVEELEEEGNKRDLPDMTRPPSEQDLRQRIWKLVKAADATITTREACEAYVQRVTGLALEPDHYQAIVQALDSRAVGR